MSDAPSPQQRKRTIYDQLAPHYEKAVFRMPYETFMKATNAKEFQIKLDQVKFSVGETQREALRELLNHMKPRDHLVAPILH